jgi:ADP-heptose:LPS heptosyltransferase
MHLAKGDVKKILIVRIGKIGDTIVTHFAFRRIRETYPNAVIALIALPKVKELLKYDTCFNHIHYFNKGFSYLTTLFFIRWFKADMMVDFDDSTSNTSTLFARFGGAKNKIAFGFDKIRRYLTVPVSFPPQPQHIINRLRLIAEAAGIEIKPLDLKPELSVGQVEFTQVKQHLQRANADNHFLIAVNISAGNTCRYWPTEKWIELLGMIEDFEKPVRFIILCLPEDTEKAQTIGNALPKETAIYPAYRDFHSFCSYIAQANLLISPDTSAIHIASAFSVPVIGLYFSDEWNFTNWQPMNTLFETLRSNETSIYSLMPEQVFDAYVKLSTKMANALAYS